MRDGRSWKSMASFFWTCRFVSFRVTVIIAGIVTLIDARCSRLPGNRIAQVLGELIRSLTHPPPASHLHCLTACRGSAWCFITGGYKQLDSSCSRRQLVTVCDNLEVVGIPLFV